MLFIEGSRHEVCVSAGGGSGAGPQAPVSKPHGGGGRRGATQKPAAPPPRNWRDCGIKATAAGLSTAIDYFTLGELREGMALGRLSTRLLSRAKQRLSRNGMYFGNNVVDELAGSSAARMLSNSRYGAAFSEIFSSMTNEAKFTGSPWSLVPFSGSAILLVEAGTACFEAITGG